jgi:hypothetical protein
MCIEVLGQLSSCFAIRKFITCIIIGFYSSDYECFRFLGTAEIKAFIARDRKLHLDFS